MTIVTKLSMFSVLGLIIAAPAAAQKPDWSQKGDYLLLTRRSCSSRRLRSQNK